MAHLPNGVNFSHFARPDVPVPPEYASIRRPIAVYAGYMDAWFDYALLNRAVAALPDVSFVLIGGTPHAHARFASAPNLHLLGPRPFSRLPEYLRAADVGLIPFDVQNHPTLVHSIHPLKLYEYLAAGLPVVATRWRELERLQSPATLCESPGQFVSAIKSCVTCTPQPELYRTYAEQADWKHRVSRLLQLVQSG
jgi:glycosyltransferase involved in cell wall biosynthesis